MNVFSSGKKYSEYIYLSEDEFEKDIVTFHKLIFGKKRFILMPRKN